MLVQITGTHMFCPFHLAFVRLQFAGNNVHERGFSLAVRAHQTDMLSL